MSSRPRNLRFLHGVSRADARVVRDYKFERTRKTSRFRVYVAYPRRDRVRVFVRVVEPLSARFEGLQNGVFKEALYFAAKTR